MDLKGFLAGDVPIIEGRGLGGLTEAPPRKPLIAAVEGYAAGGRLRAGAGLRPGGRRRDRAVRRTGGEAGAGRRRRRGAALPQRIPQAIALELLLTGEPIDARAGRRSSAWSTGSCRRARRSTPRSSWPRTVAANGPLAVAVTKQIARSAPDWRLDEGWQKQGELMGPVFVSEDAQEGARAFAEKRPPVWKGR